MNDLWTSPAAPQLPDGKAGFRWPWQRAPEPRLLFDAYGQPYHAGTAAPLSPAEVEQIEPARRFFWTRRSRWWWISRIVAAAIMLFFLLILWLIVTAPLSKSLEPIAPPQITLLAADGSPIARNGAVVERPVEIATLPPHVVQAFLAIEDRRFYTHWGVDPRALGRALVSNVTGGQVQGGSTITQQLAKFTFLTAERSLTRKAREMLIAFWLEARLSKDDILERYLSNAYFGDNVYGLRAASLHYFYRQPERLKPEQAILLAGLVQAPSRYAPSKHPQRARERAQIVTSAMVAAGYLTQAEADALPRAIIDVRAKRELPTGTYFADWAFKQAREEFETGYDHLRLTSTLDPGLQRTAERIIRRNVPAGAQGALVAMRPNGEIVAMVGGKNYAQSAFNRVTQAQRQPGSTFKLFVWLAALRAGMEPGTMVDDSAITTGSYRPKNARERYRGAITLEEAFVQSSNVVAYRLLQQLGDEAVRVEARNLGVDSPLARDDPSIALGTSTMTLLELTAAYAGVAANSWPVKPHAFVRAEQSWWDWLFTRPGSYSSSTHAAMEQMLRAAVNRGTGRAAALTIPNFGKTGTSQDNRDALFVGYAGDLVVGVWIGRDDNMPLAGINGGGLPARIWKDFMGNAVKGAGRTAAPRRRSAPASQADSIEDGVIDINGAQIDLGDNPSLRIPADVGALPLDVVIGSDGVSVEPGDRDEPPE